MATLPESGAVSTCEGTETAGSDMTWLIKDGRITETGDGLEAVRQCVWIMLHTERYRYQIFTSDFGAELYSLIGKPPVYAGSMVKRRVEEALSADSRIKGISNYDCSTDAGGDMICSFDVNTVYGTFRTEVGL